MSGRESLSLRFLYRTAPGRAFLKLLTRPGLSRLAGRYLDSRASRWLIPRAMRAWGVDPSEFEDVEYGSFNAFFTRRRRKELLRVDMEPDHLISPCDGRLSAHEIAPDSSFQIKNSAYGLDELLGSAAEAERFRGGLCLIFRLAPADYHRYCFADDAEFVARGAIPGVLHCVRPIACERYPVYLRNSREWTLLRSERFGWMAQVEIGALLVGRIDNLPRRPGERVRRGQEKGCFAFGGSTILLLLEPGRVKLDKRFSAGPETPVRLGTPLGLRGFAP